MGLANLWYLFKNVLNKIGVSQNKKYLYFDVVTNQYLCQNKEEAQRDCDMRKQARFEQIAQLQRIK